MGFRRSVPGVRLRISLVDVRAARRQQRPATKGRAPVNENRDLGGSPSQAPSPKPQARSVVPRALVEKRAEGEPEVYWEVLLADRAKQGDGRAVGLQVGQTAVTVVEVAGEFGVTPVRESVFEIVGEQCHHLRAGSPRAWRVRAVVRIRSHSRSRGRTVAGGTPRCRPDWRRGDPPTPC